ncbi:hypothetical protein BJAS_P3475 [Bathymodiolus japonicus methanotrophic gill symbiont]|uniref:hypothetical protein n=1 Tax=Bathymodiolus japonicus methanotrophic gill symbiont TaxID=113269 RepID=UPI001B3D9E11|nr:hypothetical protein [Bathymodiolus japonicus methanotrophic gill symbiont]GFO72938.1 hypothetical protein BJAS_P3475 [Bathymodiolus japonicus methanotrophic gill symbiont]
MKKTIALLLIMTNTAIASPRFIDKELDGSTAHLGHRHLSLATGRFLTQDIDKQYPSHYNYGSGHPITESDPTGTINYKVVDDAIKLLDDVIASESAGVIEDLQHTDAPNEATKATIQNSIITPDNISFSFGDFESITVEREPVTKEVRQPVVARQTSLDVEFYDAKEVKIENVKKENKEWSARTKAGITIGVVALQLIVAGGLIAILLTKK